ncbi:hypothetical protein BOX15_Mlig021058g1, partial [Macrostomum lignano]
CPICQTDKRTNSIYHLLIIMSSNNTGGQQAIESEILRNSSAINIDSLLDCVSALCDDLKYPLIRKSKNVSQFLERYEDLSKQIKRWRIRYTDFELIKVIGRGAYGEVQLVRKKDSQELFALKLLSKADVLKRSESSFFWEEREIMATSNSDWIVQLHYAFQDEKYLYMAMEFLQGGDMTALLPEDEDSPCLPENTARFYIAELVLALEALHDLGFVHRDVKPENCLLDSRGHLKLADFGTAVRLDPKTKTVTTSTTIGTPDYICPEMLTNQGKSSTYSFEVDWWSVGVVLFELVCGYTPFAGDDLLETYSCIMDHKNSLQKRLDEGLPQELSETCLDIVRQLLEERTKRLRLAKDVKNHNFFVNSQWTWDRIRAIDAPFPIELTSDIDTRYFFVDDPEPSRKANRELLESEPKAYQGGNLPFIGFSFRQQQWFSGSGGGATGSGGGAGAIAGGANVGAGAGAGANGDELDRLRAKEQALSAEISRLREAESKAKLGLMEAETSLHNLRQEKSRLEAQLNSLRQAEDESQRLHQEADAALAKLRDAGQQAEQLRRQLDDERAALRNAESTLKALTAEKEAAMLELEDLRAQLASLEKSKTELEERVRQAEAKHSQERQELLSGHQAETRDLQQELRSVRDEKEALRKQAAELEHQKDELDRRLRQAELEAVAKDRSESAKQELSAELARANEQLSGVQAELRKARDRELELAGQLAEERQRQRAGEAEIAAGRTRIGELEAELASLKERYDAQAAQHKKLADRLKQKTNELKELGEKYDTDCCFLELYKTELDELKKESAKEAEALKAEKDSLAAEAAKLRSSAKATEDELQAEKSARNALQTQKTEQERRLLLLELERDKHADACSELAKQKESVEQQLSQLSQQITSLESDKSALLAEVTSLKKRVSEEAVLKNEAVNKLIRLMQDPTVQKAARSDAMDSGRRGQSNRKARELDAELKREREIHRRKVEQKDVEIQDLRVNLDRMQVELQELQLVLEQRESMIEEYERRLANSSHVDTFSMTSSDNRTATGSAASTTASDTATLSSIELPGASNWEGFLSVPKANRRRGNLAFEERYVVVSQRSVAFYRTKEEKDSQERPAMVLELAKIFHARPITQNDALHADKKDIPRILQLLYEADGEAKDKVSREVKSGGAAGGGAGGPDSSSLMVMHNGHKFVPITYRMPTHCDVCAKPCFAVLNPPPALECRQCHTRIHRDHVELADRPIHHCKVYDEAKSLLLLAGNDAEMARWVKEIERRVKALDSVRPNRHKEHYSSGRGKGGTLNRESSFSNSNF